MIGLLLHNLKLMGVINKNNNVNVKFNKKLFKFPALLQQVILETQFLRYDASILARLHCLLQKIREQPTCKTCKNIVKMRTSGRERYKFPTYCSGGCAAKDEEVKMKRKLHGRVASIHN